MPLLHYPAGWTNNNGIGTAAKVPINVNGVFAKVEQGAVGLLRDFSYQPLCPSILIGLWQR